MNPTPSEISVSPEPTPLEMAAILAAYQGLWPQAPEEPKRLAQSNRWRFSGRWWNDAGLRNR